MSSETPAKDAMINPASTASPIADLTYRGYDGPLHNRAIRWWVVTSTQLGLVWRKPWIYIVLGLAFMRVLLSAFNVYLHNQFGIAAQDQHSQEVDGHTYALELWRVMCGYYNTSMVLLVALIVGVGSIAADNQANALLVYLSKPLGKMDYLIGKWMSVFLTILFISLVPAMMLYLFFFISYFKDGFFKEEPWLILQVLACGALPALLHSSLLMGFSAWSKSPRVVGAVYASFYLLGGIVANLIGSVLYKDNITMRDVVSNLSISGVIRGVSQNIFRVTRPEPPLTAQVLELVKPPLLWPLLTLGIVLIVLGIAAARMKINAVEVIRG